MKKAVIGLSGGMDSATLLGELLEQGYSVICCSFKYPSKHNEWELSAAKQIVSYYQAKNMPVIHHVIDVSTVFQFMGSDLLQSGGEIPEGHYASDNMKKTVVPGRNMIFTSIMAGIAETVEAGFIALGVHSGDHFIYPDCRKDFIKAVDLTVFLSSDKTVEIITPFAVDDKASILQRGYKYAIPVPYHLTRTCYKDQELSCGKCGSCNERLEAFSLINKSDPITYERE
ncbi:MAG: 7-cyano-7-deazaguanine synthase QueC [Bacteroidota bacterium]